MGMGVRIEHATATPAATVFKGSLTVVDRSKGTVVKVIDLNAVSQSKRNKTADTRILEN
jgi:hypothetical protein